MPKKQKKKNDSKSKEESVNKSSNKENKNYIENSSQQNLESIEELKNKINLLEKKASDLEKKNIYYYNIIKKNENMYRNNFNDGSIEDFIEYKRYQNLNGYNSLMIDINDKINEFIQEEELRDKAKLEYYETIKNLKDDIEYRLYFMKLLREKERLRDIERYQINKQFYVLKYDKNTGEVNPNRFKRYYLNNRYGNPYDIKSFNNNNYMRPARMNKNGVALSNQFISLNQPTDIKRYEIYDKYRDEYKSHIKNILLDTGSSFFDTKLNFKKYDIKGKRITSSSSSSNIYS
jgi:hypothetical protein